MNDLFPRIRLHMANFDVTEYPELKRVGGFMWVRGDPSKPLDPALEFHVVIRENWNLAGTQPRIRKFLSLMHELGHIAGYDHDDDPSTDDVARKCVTRNVNDEDMLNFGYAEWDNPTISCTERETKNCYSVTVTSPPTWIQVHLGEDNEPPETYCGTSTVSDGFTGELLAISYWGCDKEVVLCYDLLEEICDYDGGGRDPGGGNGNRSSREASGDARLAERGQLCSPAGPTFGNVLAAAGPPGGEAG